MTKGYIEFFFSNAKYRRLWAASVISLLGEWFNTIALFLLILEYSGSEFLLGILFSVRMILFGISQPINGLLADRLNRKSLMLWSNIAQIFLALTFLMVDGPEDMWWLIGVSGIMMLWKRPLGIFLSDFRFDNQLWFLFRRSSQRKNHLG